MRRALAAAFLAAGAASAVFAGDASIRDEVDAALRRGDRTAALALLDAVRDEGRPGDRARSVEAARAAMDLVGPPEGSMLAARILVDTLARDPSRAGGAWDVAMGLRSRAVRREIDLASAQRLLAGLAAVYPQTLDYAKDLALVYRDAGLTEEARAQYLRLCELSPSATDVRYRLAALEEDAGRFDAAVAVYDELIALHAADPTPELLAHHDKGWLLLDKVRDPAAAKRAADAGIAAAQAMAPGLLRDEFLARFATLTRRIGDEVEHRRRLRALGERLDAVLLWTGVLWAAVLGGAWTLLRRARWI